MTSSSRICWQCSHRQTKEDLQGVSSVHCKVGSWNWSALRQMIPCFRSKPSSFFWAQRLKMLLEKNANSHEMRHNTTRNILCSNWSHEIAQPMHAVQWPFWNTMGRLHRLILMQKVSHIHWSIAIQTWNQLLLKSQLRYSRKRKDLFHLISLLKWPLFDMYIFWRG